MTSPLPALALVLIALTLIGRGSTGEVWAAESAGGDPVAIKILAPDGG